METNNYLLVFSPELTTQQIETIQNSIPSKTLKTIPEEHSDIIDECFNNIHAYKGSVSCFYTDDIKDAKSAVSNLKCNTRRDNGCFHETGFQTH